MTIAISLLIGAISILGAYCLAPRSRKSESNPSPDPDSLKSVLIPAYTTHARFLPNPSRHAFSYPLLYLGVDIDSLENGSLDLGRLIRYGGPSISTIVGLKSDNYLEPGRESLRYKVEKLLESKNISKEILGRVWLVTIPSFLGFEGINPLSVWYCYKKRQVEEKPELLCVILEVHNTFGEKHAYVLPGASKLREQTAEGYHYSWIFPRSFHVSPFNSRNGFYRLDLVDPFHFTSDKNGSQPQIKVFLKLLTPSKSVKLQALLASSPSRPAIPISSENTFKIAKTIARYPLSLLMTTPRIMYQAYWLHYEKKLAVYPRPEPNYQGAVKEWNPPQIENQIDAEAAIGMGIGWQDESWTEKLARHVISEWCRKRASETGIDLKIKFLDRRSTLHFEISQEHRGHKITSKINQLIVQTADPKFFVNLLVAPSTSHWLLLAPEQLSTPSNASLFEQFFAPEYFDAKHRPRFSWISTLIDRRRYQYLSFLFMHSYSTPPPHLVIFPRKHFSSTLSLVDQLKVYLVVWFHTFTEMLEEKIMTLMGAKFVEGREPWKVFDRALRRLYMFEEKLEDVEDLGSIRL